MPVEFFDHTADVGARVSAPSLEGLFIEAAAALTETVCDRSGLRPRLARAATLSAADVDQLLVDWLSELIGRFDIEQFLTHSATVAIVPEPDARGSVAGYRLEATLYGESAAPERHPIKVLVKGVTYHELHIEQTDRGWETTVVFDI